MKPVLGIALAVFGSLCLDGSVLADTDLQQTLERANYRADSATLATHHDALKTAYQKAAAHDAQGAYDFALSAYLLADVDADSSHASVLLREAEDALAASPANAADEAETAALLGLVYGAEIGLHPIKGMWLGPKASAALERARKTAPGNPRVQLFLGISSYMTPSTFGGDRKRAHEEFAAALSAFDTFKSTGQVHADWGRARAHAWLGAALADDGDASGARREYAAALTEAPDYVWVKDRLLPKLGGSGATADASARPSAANPATMPPGNGFALHDVRVFDGARVLAKANVIVREGRIEAVGADVAIPADLPIIEGRGKTVLPGLIDAHVHTWGDARRDALRFGVTTELDMFTDWHTLVAAKKQRASLARTDQADEWSSGTLVTAPKGHGTEYGMTIPTLDKATDASAFVDARVKEGSDYIKIILDDGSAYGPDVHIPTLSADEVGAVIAAAHHGDKLAVIHVATEKAARLAIEDGVDGLAHVFMDKPAGEDIVELAKRRHPFVIATLAVTASIAGADAGRDLRDDPRMKPMLSAGQYDMLGQPFPHTHPAFLNNALTSVGRLHTAGVPILAGTDAGNPGTAHGASLHGELALLVKAGLTPVEALGAATALPARSFHLDDRGRIARGMRADLVLVDGDPTTDITATRAIRTIWKNGYAIDRTLKDEDKPALATGSVAPTDPLVSDFDGDAIASRFGSWSTTTDAIMGGVSAASMHLAAGGAEGSKGALEVAGEVKSGAPFPWAGVMFNVGEQPMQPIDFSSRKEIVFWTKGDDRDYSVLLFSGTAASGIPRMQPFHAGTEWKQVRVPLAAFAGGDPARLRAIGFTAGGATGAFGFLIDRVEIR
ncbi:CIA30 family protein [Dokdonella soli]|uniref:Amidohydrolase n=1 Tax=Dokdonella soli TaxID=529810 RepID=A0ABN1ITK7_9GAMM